jgi:hypothetical protein
MLDLPKKLVKRLPRLRSVFAERDHLRNERERLRAEQQQLLVQRDEAMAELGRLRAERDRVRGERDLTLSERYELFLERDRVRMERDQALAQKEELLKGQWVPPGHYYSPIPSLAELKAREQEIWGRFPRELPAIDLNENEQLGLFDVFKNYYREMPDFPAEKQEHLRYHYQNDYYPYGDAIPLHSMIRYLRPRRIIEVGSGFSSCVTLDTNELYFENSITCTFIEPYPQRLQSLLKPTDKIDLVEKNLQDVDLKLFGELGPRDVLFIDSTHVAKCGSDVNYIFFEILPALARGVSVHVHDIFYPFEYPQGWVYGGKAWSEDYMLRAFLQYNNAFKIQYFNSYLVAFHRGRMEADMPLCLRYPGGSIWLRKV